MAKPRTLLLVAPRHEFNNLWALKELGALLGKTSATFPLALPTLAALTPPGWEITLIDEDATPLDPRRRYGLVGISSMITNTKRAFALADAFRADGSYVVMGGPYTTLRHEESLRHADTVVIGEAEELWPRFLADLDAGRPQPVYRCEAPPSLARQPFPRWDLVDTRRSLALNVQLSRGCPNGCEFCCVPAMFGTRQRYRAVEEVVAEIAGLPSGQISFVDDNLTSDKAYARRLVAALMPLRVSWNCLCGQDVADDPELLAGMAAAGCHTILIGFESLRAESLEMARRKQRAVPRYREVVARINAAGIHVTGAFIVGFDADGPEAFDEVLAFYRDTELSYVMLNLLTAFPGTALHAALEREGRTLDIPHECLTGAFPSFRYAQLEPRAAFERLFETLERMYSYAIVREKLPRIYASGAFRPPRRAIGTRDKIVGMRKAFGRFLFTRDRDKRALFLWVMGAIRRRELDPDRVFEYLFLVEAANDYLKLYRSRRGELLARIDGYADLRGEP
jgi:radical SAM superfamily enzyme YgiQ (UPF0313 family)